MTDSTHTEQVLSLLANNGLLRPIDLDAVGIPRVTLTRMLACGQLERVARGLYQLPGTQISEHMGLTAVASKAPQAVFCLLTALQFHELTTQLPHRIWIAMPRGSHTPRISYPPVRMLQFADQAYSEGIEVFERDHVRLRVYGVAKTLADCFKFRNAIGVDIALEALKEARAQQKVSADDIWRYARICRVTNVMRPYLESIE